MALRILSILTFLVVSSLVFGYRSIKIECMLATDAISCYAETEMCSVNEDILLLSVARFHSFHVLCRRLLNAAFR